jgi:tRNA A-37 threonylcarbamoyl transferase component Bud32
MNSDMIELLRKEHEYEQIKAEIMKEYEEACEELRKVKANLRRMRMKGQYLPEVVE